MKVDYFHVNQPLRKSLSANDAVYVALAEALDTVVLTCDGRLARAPGVARRVEQVRPTN